MKKKEEEKEEKRFLVKEDRLAETHNRTALTFRNMYVL